MIFFQKQLSILFLFIFSSISIVGNAQNTEITPYDSLKNKTPKELVSLIKSPNSKQIKIYEKILEDFHKNKNDTIIGKIYIELGYFFLRKEDFKKSIKYANKFLGINDELADQDLIFQAHIIKGASFLLQGKYEDSFDNYDNALSIAQKQKNPENIIIANSGRILVLQKMNKLNKALEISKETIQSINKTSFYLGENHVRILTNINEIYLDKEQYDSVLYFADKGIKMSKSLDFKEGLVDLFIKKGIVYYHLKDYENAFSNLNEAKDILENNDVSNNFLSITKVNYYMASCYYEKQDYDKSISYLCQTMGFIKEEDLIKLPVIKSHLLLANCYFKKKDFKQGHYWQSMYINLNKNYLKNKDITVNLIDKKEIEKHNREITQLKNKKNVANYLLIISIAISLILTTIGFKYYKKQKIKKVMFVELLEQINLLEAEKNTNLANNNKAMVIDNDKVVAVLKGLDKLEREKFYLKSKCNLHTTAKKVKTNSTYLTKIIHTHKGKKFNEYITDLRITYALHRLKNDKKFRAFSVKSIAIEIGYKSDGAFAKHFKAKTGLNPSYYISNIEKQNKKNT